MLGLNLLAADGGDLGAGLGCRRREVSESSEHL